MYIQHTIVCHFLGQDMCSFNTPGNTLLMCRNNTAHPMRIQVCHLMGQDMCSFNTPENTLLVNAYTAHYSYRDKVYTILTH